MTATPQVISRVLRKAGFGIVADYSREGTRVSRDVFGCARVTAQFDGELEAKRVAASIAELLTEKGFIVENHGASVTVK